MEMSSLMVRTGVMRLAAVAPALIATVAMLCTSAGIAAAQTSRRPSVFIRDVRIDSMLVASGVDSARVREAISNVLRDAGRLAPAGENVPALDVEAAVPRLSTGGLFEPRGFVRVEVGRNLMEIGKANRLVWQGITDFREVPTWRELARGTLAEILTVVNRYLMPGVGGA
jgi:hypothetical protein